MAFVLKLMVMENKIKSRAKVDLGLAAALFALLPLLDIGYQISLIVVIAILVVAALILLRHDRFSTTLGKRLVKIAYDIDIGYIALAVVLYGPGIAFLQNQWWFLGVIFLLTSAFFIGWGFMQSLAPLLERSRG